LASEGALSMKVKLIMQRVSNKKYNELESREHLELIS
jgi:hypothetical protein